MRLTRSASATSFFDKYFNKNKDDIITPDKSYKEERIEAEKKAMEFSSMRKVQASQYPDMTLSRDEHPGFKEEASDTARVIDKASQHLDKHIASLIGKGGYNIKLDDSRIVKSHEDLTDYSGIADEAVFSFAVDFTVPNSIKTAKFIVAYTGDSDSRFNVHECFYDENESEYELNSDVLSKYLTCTEMDTVKKEREIPVCFYSPDSGVMELVPTGAPSESVVARLKASGFKVEKEYVDACYDPHTFGRLCFRAYVPLGKSEDFKKIAAMSEDEWFNRGKEQSYKHKEVAWPDRTLEKGSYDKKDFGKPDNWFNRTEDKNKDKNPYGTDMKMLASDASKKDGKGANRSEAVKKALASNSNPDIIKDIEELENLCK